VSRGGAQRAFGITPDLGTFAKILAGGLPGGAVAGRKDILDELDFDVAAAKGREKNAHPGPYNANPLSPSAGPAAPGPRGPTDACDKAIAYGAEIRGRLNEIFEAERLPWAVHGSFSGFHIFLNPKGRDIAPTTFDPLRVPFQELSTGAQALAHKFRLALLI